MENLFIPYELALMAKEKRFDAPCLGRYHKRGNNIYLTIIGTPIDDGINEFLCYAPLYQQIVDWLRGKHGIVVFVEPLNVVSYKAKVSGILGEWEAEKYDMYYFAMEEAIKEAFKLIK